MNKVIFGGGKNCLNSIRLLAALQVVYGHTLAHMEIPGIPVLGTFLNFFSGVPIFFTMSGFLIWSSIGRSNSFGEYLQKRFWRIFPELWVAVAVELAVLLLFYREPVSWPQFGAFAFTQSTIFQFWTPDCLRGYGCGCPNGSLWTICVLIQFYFFAFYLFKFLHGKKFIRWAATFIVSLGISLLIPYVREMVPEIVGKLLSQTLLPYLWMFILPAYVAEKKEVLLPVLIKYWWIFLVTTLMISYSGFDITAAYAVLHTISLFACLTGASYVFSNLNVKTDISYGIYIYHMTVVNALLELGFMHDTWLLALVVLITCLLSWISTKTVGEYCINRKKALVTK